MNNASYDMRGAAWFGETMLWIGAGLFVLGIYVGVFAWMLHAPVPKAVTDEVAQSAIMIEFAPKPEAIHIEELEIASGDQVSDEAFEEPEEIVEPVEPEMVEELPQEIPIENPVEVPAEIEQVEPEITDVPQVEPELVKAEIMEEVVTAAAPVPAARLHRKVEEKKKKTKSSAPKQTVRKAQAKVKKSTRTAASQNSTGRVASSVTPARWKSRLMAHLERRKRYPSGSRHRGGEIVYVRFKIDIQGNVSSVTLARSSGNAKLDKGALDTVRRASPVPAPPPSVKRVITVPIRYDK